MIDRATIALVRDARKWKAEVDAEIASARLAWETEHSDLLARQRLCAESVASQEAALRAAIVEEYTSTGNKAPAPGCGIRIVTRLAYDPKAALDWAKAHGLALKLDTPLFEKIAKAQPIEGVSVVGEVQATIATDLDKALAEERN